MLCPTVARVSVVYLVLTSFRSSELNILLFYVLMVQMNELADIARCVANTPLNDDRSTSYLISCLEDLKVVTERRKWDALTVETFATRIEKLIR